MKIIEKFKSFSTGKKIALLLCIVAVLAIYAIQHFKLI